MTLQVDQSGRKANKLISWAALLCYRISLELTNISVIAERFTFLPAASARPLSKLKPPYSSLQMRAASLSLMTWLSMEV